MPEHPMIRGRTQKEKNDSIQQILKSLTRRVVKRATVYIPPVPLFMSCEVIGDNNLIGKVLVPFSGTIKDLFFRIGEMHTSIVKVSLTMVSDVEGRVLETKVYTTIPHYSFQWSLSMEVVAGTLLQLYVEEGSCADVLVATAVYPDIDAHKAQEYLLEEILKQEKEEAS
jgi:hypothetical protein